MKVVDLRNIFANCNDQLIEISDNRIYYAEEKNEEGHNSLFLLEYNRITRREREKLAPQILKLTEELSRLD